MALSRPRSKAFYHNEPYILDRQACQSSLIIMPPSDMYRMANRPDQTARPAASVLIQQLTNCKASGS